MTPARSAPCRDFRDGKGPVLVSVKSLVEGIDVPDADVGVSVAASASVRQRVQSLGRVLRRQFDESAGRKVAEMHLVYVADTVDELIYAKEDWGDITGESANHYWKWPTDPDLQPERVDGPPATPRPTEEAEWERLGSRAPNAPEPWLGSFIGQEYSVDTMGNVTNRSGAIIENPQEVGAMVEGRPRTRRWTVPCYPAALLVLATRGDGEGTVFVAGQLDEPFGLRRVRPSPMAPSTSVCCRLATRTRASRPGARLIQDPVESGRRHRATGAGERNGVRAHRNRTLPSQAANAKRLLAAWREAADRGITFHVNALGHAWYNAGRHAPVPGGCCGWLLMAVTREAGQ